MAPEAVEFLAALGVPEFGDTILTGRSNPVRVGTDRDTENGGLMAQGGQGLAPQSLEVVPLPAAQVVRALVEQLFHPAEVVRRPLEMRRGNPLVVQVLP